MKITRNNNSIPENRKIFSNTAEQWQEIKNILKFHKKFRSLKKLKDNSKMISKILYGEHNVLATSFSYWFATFT